MKNYCIIPALEKNVYSKYGDLVNWGDSSLLEWKISQAKESKIFNEIIVSTPSKKIVNIAKKNNVGFLLRKKNLSLEKLYVNTALKLRNRQLTWLSPTFPFISPYTIKKCVENFNKIKNRNDSYMTAIRDSEYFFYKKKALNFNFNKKVISRRKITPIMKLVPAVIIINSQTIIKKKNIFGNKPNFYEIDWFSSLEINTPNDIDIFNLLIKEYFKKNFK